MRNVQVRKLRHREGQSLAPCTQQGIDRAKYENWPSGTPTHQTRHKHTHHVPACSPGVPPQPAVHRAADTPRSADCRPRRGCLHGPGILGTRPLCEAGRELRAQHCSQGGGHWEEAGAHRGSLEKLRQEYRGMEIHQQGTGNRTGVNGE